MTTRRSVPDKSQSIRDQIPASMRGWVMYAIWDNPPARDKIVLGFLPPGQDFRRFIFEVTPEGLLREEDIAHLCAVL